jgi:hypothetical protein
VAAYFDRSALKLLQAGPEVRLAGRVEGSQIHPPSSIKGSIRGPAQEHFEVEKYTFDLCCGPKMMIRIDESTYHTPSKITEKGRPLILANT